MHLEYLAKPESATAVVPRAVVFTALGVEYAEVRRHLRSLSEETDSRGTVYERGLFDGRRYTWEVVLVQTGKGNLPAAVEAERAISRYGPNVVLFVGIAGGLKDVEVGDVVAATDVYGYESGRAERAFRPRPNVAKSTYRMVQRARAEAIRTDWLARAIQYNTPPRVFVGPIAAGEKVVVSLQAPIFKFLRHQYGDALAVEMEGRGFLEASYANLPVEALIVRGISDLIERKAKTETKGSQELAAHTASAFAFEVLSKLELGMQELSKPDIGSAATRTREALETKILPRIPRPVFLRRLMASVRQGICGEQSRIVAIVGPAGYGKSTTLGAIYDELVKTLEGWYCLFRCNDLAVESMPTAELLEHAFGAAASGHTVRIGKLAQALTAAHGRGVVLIDTLDLILDEQLVPMLRMVLLNLLDAGATVVFTCRDFEYGLFLEPPRERLPGLSANIDRHNVPPFDDSEVRAAAIAFASTRDDLRSFGDIFATNLLDLSADNRPLKEIVRNPLLLGMLCDLFAGGRVPPDLTVSRLYDQYWRHKVSGSRKFGSASVTALTKERLSLRLAEKLCSMSVDRMHDSVADVDLELPFDAAFAQARADLLSDGVLELLAPVGRLRFFHQTFLEYAMARWLATASGKDARMSLLHLLRDAESRATRMHWWPVVRLLLSILEPQELLSSLHLLDLSSIEAFRSAALAAVPRNDPTVLKLLVEVSLSAGVEHQRVLVGAIESVVTVVSPGIWRVSIAILRHGAAPAVARMAHACGGLLARETAGLRPRLEQVLTALEDRQEDMAVALPATDAAAARGWIVEPLLRAMVADQGALQVLRGWFLSFGARTRAGIIRVHLNPPVSAQAQKELLHEIAQHPLAPEVVPAAIDLAEQVLANKTPPCVSPWGSWAELLHMVLPYGWREVQVAAVGRLAAGDTDVLTELVKELFDPQNGTPDREFSAIEWAARHGGRKVALFHLLDTLRRAPAVERLDIAGSLLARLAKGLETVEAEHVAHNLEQLARSHPGAFVHVYGELAHHVSRAHQVLRDLILSLPKPEQVPCLSRLLQNAREPLLTKLLSEFQDAIMSASGNEVSQKTIIRLHTHRAMRAREPVELLLNWATSGSKSMALAATEGLLKLAATSSHLHPQDVVVLANSKHEGVRVKLFDVLMRFIESGTVPDDETLSQVFMRMRSEIVEPVLRRTCDLLARWVRTSRRIPPHAMDALGNAVERVIAGPLDAGTARAVIVALKVVAQLESAPAQSNLEEWARALVRSIDLRRVRDGESEAVDVLSAIARGNPDFLRSLVDEASSFPPKNVRAIAIAIRRVEGKGSELLDLIFQSDWCDPDSKNLILTFRNA